MKPIVLLTGDTLDPNALVPAGGHDPACGAVASFAGHVRANDGLTALELIHHPVLTERALEQIGEHAMAQFGLQTLVIAHRHGRMAVGEMIVYISAGAAHRRAALDAVSYTIDVLKTQAPFWKREWRGTKSDWIEPTTADHTASDQWMETNS
ncbi:molybdenum cofactor biosynthesis protein MoaE [Maricaulis sp.]|uniref:molybdenum cofactor biosynthesis protein MoaE n=1 Tax=Maricaulis sp. TaxID=1486257 RepID=UPI002B26FC6A|nr:molybdenum cofactor biosynthesis protein MoaE [Maricaulis sp.]